MKANRNPTTFDTNVKAVIKEIETFMLGSTVKETELSERAKREALAREPRWIAGTQTSLQEVES